MNRRWLIPGGVALLVLALGCAIAVAPRFASSADGAGRPATSMEPVGSVQPYRLLIHCGIEFAMFDGRWWRAEVTQERPREEPSPDPNFIDGTMTRIAHDRIHFRSSDGQVNVDFIAYDGQPALCE